jgi:gliding motility-associated-like protein
MKDTITQSMKKKFVLILLAAMPLFNYAQLSITTNTVATTLAQTIVGSGVSVGNANLKCGVHASGTFTDTGSDLGLAKGVILTTGYATDAGGPAVFANYNENSHGVPTYSDPALVGIGGTQAIYDVCILTFTFVPVCSSLSIQYVFGSEEYPKYIDSYNDAFGIFLSGANPSGGNYSLTNIATLPNGHNTPVSIDSVNGGYTTAEGATTGANAPIAASNPSYYVNNYSNSGGSTSPGANGDISYHGYTIPITSVASVNPCQTYTLEIAVADGGNGNYDSGVFIQAGSISCSSTPASASTPDNCNSSNGTATIVNAPSNATYSWSPGGLTTYSIGGLVNGSYTCVVNVPATSCTSATSYTIPVTVPSASVAPAGNVTISATQNNCGSSNGTASVSISGLTGTPSYTWMPGGDTATSSISGLAAGIYTCNVAIASCGVTTHTTVTATVTTITPPTPSVTSSAIAPSCSGNSGSAAISVTNTTATPTYSWSSGQTTGNISGVPAGTYSCNVTIPNCPSATHTTVVVVIPIGTNIVSPSFSLSPNTGNAPLSVTVTNTSAGASTYTWTFGNGATSNLQNPNAVTYSTPGTYSVILYASQGAGCTVPDTEIVVVSEANIIIPNIFSPNGDAINDLFTITGFGITNFDCVIYDRWGLEMFESTSVTNSWDGKNKRSAAVPDGIYFYIIKATDINLKANTYKGFVTLIR